MLIEADKAALLVVDVQDWLIGAITDPEGTLARLRWLLQVAAELELEVLISEQYPQGLGHTLTALTALVPAARVVEKRHFSCVADGCLPPDLLAREQVIVCGMETHVCVLQTVLGLRALGRQVFVVDDACASRTPYNHAMGIQRMRDAGAQIVTREMVAFELLHTSTHAKFRHISKTFLVGEQP